jgi:hypothetical protein
MDEDNGRFPDDSAVKVRYPRDKQEEQGDRSAWPWLPAHAPYRQRPRAQ